MSRTSASPFNVTLIGSVPKVEAQHGANAIEPVR